MEVASPLTFSHTSAGAKRQFPCSPGFDTTNRSPFSAGMDSDEFVPQRSFKRRRFTVDESMEGDSENTINQSPFLSHTSHQKNFQTATNGEFFPIVVPVFFFSISFFFRLLLAVRGVSLSCPTLKWKNFCTMGFVRCFFVRTFCTGLEHACVRISKPFRNSFVASLVDIKRFSRFFPPFFFSFCLSFLSWWWVPCLKWSLRTRISPMCVFFSLALLFFLTQLNFPPSYWSLTGQSFKRCRTEAFQNDLQRVVNTQAAEIDSLKSEKSSLETSMNNLKSEHDKVLSENKILKKAVTIQQERQNQAASEIEAARQFKFDAEARIKKLEQIILSLRYHLQAQQSNPGNDFMGFPPRPPDVY